MKAVFLGKQGREIGFRYGNLPKPKPQKGEALIKVKAAALNHLDLRLANAKLNIPLPHVSGSDVAGEISEINGPSKLKVGQAVVVNPSIPCGSVIDAKKAYNGKYDDFWLQNSRQLCQRRGSTN